MRQVYTLDGIASVSLGTMHPSIHAHLHMGALAYPVDLTPCFLGGGKNSDNLKEIHVDLHSSCQKYWNTDNFHTFASVHRHNESVHHHSECQDVIAV